MAQLSGIADDEKYALPIYPVVIFSFETPQRQESDRYQVEFPDRRVLDFSFVAIQLNRLNWRDFLTASNPIAAALMAKMKIQPEDRPKVKAECLRLLATLRLDPARMQLISGFVDTYLKLNPSEEVLFKAELDAMDLSEEEQVMEIVTSWMERGIEQGLQQGLARESLLVLRLIKTRFRNLSPDIEERISRLSIAEIELLGESLFDFATEAEVSTWLEQREQRQEVESGILERLIQRFERVSLDIEKQIRSLPPERLTEFATLEFSTEEAMVNWLN